MRAYAHFNQASNSVMLIFPNKSGKQRTENFLTPEIVENFHFENSSLNFFGQV